MGRDPQEVREMILEKSRDILEKKGYRGTKMSDIADACGISKKTIYAHFPSKNDLVTQVATREIVIGKMAVFQDIGEEDTYADKMHGLVDGLVGYLWSQPLLLKLYLEVAGLWGADRPIGMEDLFRAPFLMAVESLSGVILQGIEAGEFRDVNPDATALILLYGFPGLLLRRIGQHNGQDNPMVLLHKSVDLILYGLQKEQ